MSTRIGESLTIGPPASQPRPRAGCGQAAAGLGLALLAVALPLADAWAANPLRLQLRLVEHPQLRAEQVDLDFIPASGDQPPALQLRARRLALPVLDQVLDQVDFQCRPERALVASAGTVPESDDPVPSPWRCEGPLRWRGGDSGWKLAWQGDESLTDVSMQLSQGNSRLTLALPLGGQAFAVQARVLRAAWLRALLPQIEWQAGRLDGRLEQVETDVGSRWRGRLDARGLAGELANANLAFEGVDLGGPVTLDTGADGALRLTATPTLNAGALLVGAVFTEWPAGSAVALRVDLARRGIGWLLREFKVEDDGFSLRATGELGTQPDHWLEQLDLELDADLGKAYGRYGDGLMTAMGHGGLRADGRFDGNISLSRGGRVAALDARLDDVGLGEPGQRFSVSGLAGQLAFRRDPGEPAPIDLRWQALSVHALRFEPGRLVGETGAGELRAAEPLQLGLFGGSVVARDLVVRPLAESRDRLQASVTVADIDIARAAAAFGWPEFGGRVDATLPGLRYGDDALRVGGAIDIDAFGGGIRIGELAIERPFGVAPALSAEVRLDNLDLEPMTEVFGFGRMEGRLAGEIDGLRLLDWRPVAFDARLRTVEAGRRRISQLAVDQLTSIGGGGGAGGVQSRLLQAFDSFGYRRIGLSCRLVNEVCTMSGLDTVAGGYTILQGSGLPLITIRGFQSRVDWPVLIERLQSALDGTPPVVR